MQQHLKVDAERSEREAGFTLIELMVVVLIVAILLAIAIPTFLGSRSRAQDRGAQSSLRNTVTSAKPLFLENNNDYSFATDTALAAVEPALTFSVAGTASTGPKEVSVEPGASVSSTFYAAALSSSGTCFYIKDSTTGGTSFAKGTGTCDGTTAASQTYSATGW